MLKLNDKVTIEVTVSGIKLTSKTMTVKALLVSLNVPDKNWHLFLAEDKLDSLQDRLCIRVFNDFFSYEEHLISDILKIKEHLISDILKMLKTMISLKKEVRKTITHKEFNQFLDWTESKYPDFCFSGEAYKSEKLNEIKEELEHEYSSDPHKEYLISDVVKAFETIEYEQNDKFKTKSVKSLLAQWLKEMD